MRIATAAAASLSLILTAHAAPFEHEAFQTAAARCDVQQMQTLLADVDANSAQIARAQARFQLTRGDSEAALQILEAAAERYPTDPELHFQLAQVLVRRIDEVSVFSKLGVARRALTAFRAAAEQAPESPVYLSAVAQYYRQAPGIAGGDTDEARAWAQRLRAVAPQHADLLLAQIALDQGQTDQALSQLQMLAEGGMVEARMWLARHEVAESRLDAAIELYRQVLAEQPDHLLALYGLGRNAAVSGQALLDGRRALEHFLALPGSLCHAEDIQRTHGYWRLGNILHQQGETEAARRAYEQALALDPDNQPARRDLKAL